MRHRTIGGVTVSAIGLGGMPMSIEGRPDEQRSVATIHAAGRAEGTARRSKIRLADLSNRVPLTDAELAELDRSVGLPASR
jgi:hypothetical protein